jgi:hypothetical protein
LVVVAVEILKIFTPTSTRPNELYSWTSQSQILCLVQKSIMGRRKVSVFVVFCEDVIAAF